MKIKVLALTIAMTLAPSISNAQVNWQMYQSNSFAWGQTTGCMVRLIEYPKMVSEDSFLSTADAENALINFLPDLYSHYEKMKQIGQKNGHVNSALPMDEWETMISDIAESEAQDGLSFLQAIGCYDILKSQGFGKR
jgi:uncharacterized protein (DUF885 family)